MNHHLLELAGVGRSFLTGGVEIPVLKGIDLTIDSGEMVAIVGASGSGKSTLMNILGCLDRPSEGSYRVRGRETGDLSGDELARLRREHFGFIFQRYHLMPHLNATQNAEIPAVYAGAKKEERRARAREILARVGLGDRLNHRPNQLSGGQQQRVSIARALMNGGDVILADEPTGALDSASGREMMDILHELHGRGHTIILVTHDLQIASHAERIIEIRDGEIVADRRSSPLPPPLPSGERTFNLPAKGERPGCGTAATTRTTESIAGPARPLLGPPPAGEEAPDEKRIVVAIQAAVPLPDPPPPGEEVPRGGNRKFSFRNPLYRRGRAREGGCCRNSHGSPHSADGSKGGESLMQANWGRFAEAFKMALIAMSAHRMRTLLTMLGIVIGITSVVSVVALGQGARQKVINDISAMGTNVIDINPGKDWGDEDAADIQTLVPADLEALKGQVYMDSATPSTGGTQLIRYRNVTANASVSGVGEQYFRVKGYELAQGSSFSEGDLRRQAQVVVIDQNSCKKFFANADPIGKVLLIGTLPCRVIGVTKAKEGPFGNSQNLEVWIPYSAAMNRLLGQQYFSSITVRVRDGISNQIAEQSIIKLLKQRHGRKDFFTNSSDSIMKTVNKTTSTLAMMIAAIAVISLVVGGIGVMNIMLVSVTERTHEIGIRMAVGARQDDIMQQFLIESVLVCLIGGMIGIFLSYGVGFLFRIFVSSFAMKFSLASIVSAFLCSTIIGVLFGFLPARNAAKLDPIEALARE